MSRPGVQKSSRRPPGASWAPGGPKVAARSASKIVWSSWRFLGALLAPLCQQHPSTIGHVAIERLSWQAIIAIPIQPINPITGIWALLKNRNTIKGRMVLSPTNQRGAVVGAVRFPIADFAGIDDAIAAMGERTVTATGIGHVIIV